MEHDAPSASTLPNNRHLVGVATKLVNILLHPQQRKPLIQQPSIRHAILLQRRPSQEPKRSQAVINRHKHNLVVRAPQQAEWRGRAAVILALVAARKPTTVDPDEHWSARLLAFAVIAAALPDGFGHNNVKEEAVFGEVGGGGWGDGRAAGVGAGGGESSGGNI